MYFKSINETVDQYRAMLELEQFGASRLPDLDLDSGNATQAGEYSLADQTYAKLLGQLKDRQFAQLNRALQANIVGFYSSPSTVVESKKNPERQKQLQQSLDQLKLVVPIDGPAQR
jgi:hypothetical protein